MVKPGGQEENLSQQLVKTTILNEEMRRKDKGVGNDVEPKKIPNEKGTSTILLRDQAQLSLVS